MLRKVEEEASPIVAADAEEPATGEPEPEG